MCGDRFLRTSSKNVAIGDGMVTNPRSGSACLDSMFQFLSGASRCSAYAAVRRAGRLSKYTPSGV